MLPLNLDFVEYPGVAQWYFFPTHQTKFVYVYVLPVYDWTIFHVYLFSFYWRSFYNKSSPNKWTICLYLVPYLKLQHSYLNLLLKYQNNFMIVKKLVWKKITKWNSIYNAMSSQWKKHLHWRNFVIGKCVEVKVIRRTSLASP